MFDSKKYQSDFPILKRTVHGDKRLVYLDNAATSQKPQQVIDAVVEYYTQHNANVHRGVHQLGDESTKLFHASRQTIANFFSAEPEELIIVRNTTEGINQVAYTWGEKNIHADDIILISEMEHHSNLVPWQELARRKNATIKYIDVDEEGSLDQADFAEKICLPNVKLVALTHISNTLGVLNPIEKMIAESRRVNSEIKWLIDAAQSAPHIPLDFHKLEVDFMVMSAHKMLGPMGIGGVLIKKNLIDDLPPFLFGGGMIDEVSLQSTTFAEDVEERFTAGTPDVAGLVGWAAACEYLHKIGMQNLREHDRDLVTYALQELQKIPQLHIVGPMGEDRIGSVAFIYDGVHAHDVGQILDSEGVAVRSGHHCTMPLHTKFHWQATCRVSFQLYNTREDIDALITALHKVKKVFGK